MAAPRQGKDLSPKPVYYLGVLRIEPGKTATELVAAKDLSSFAWLTRDKYGEFIEFASKTVAERTEKGRRNTVEEKVGEVNAYHTSFGFCVVIVTDPKYDRMVAQGFLTKVANEFRTAFTPTEIASKQAPFSWPDISKLRGEAVGAEGTGIGAVQAELDETMVVLHQTIESVLQRGEKLDTLVAKSDELSGMSKGFYKQAKQQNSCCTVM